MLKKGTKVEGLIQNTEKWLKWREDGIGGSEASCIMGTNPYDDVIVCWQRKLNLIPDITETASKWSLEAMQRGHDLEPEARQLFELEFGLKMNPVCMIHPEYDFMRASLDGLSCDGNIVLEIKCPGLTTHREALEGKIRPYYYTQMQHQMSVAGAELCYYFSYTDLDNIDTYKLIEVPRDEEYIKRLIERESIFWEYVVNKTEPDISKFEVKDAGLLNGDTRDDPAFKNALQELLEAKKVLDDASAQYNLRAFRIADLMNKKKQVKVSSSGICVEKVFNDGEWKLNVTTEEIV
jgi:putative phage-type endonuclease